jgi:hypothetical protein
MSTMNDLVTFLRARLDEDEAAAKEAASRPGGGAWGGPDDGTRHTAVGRHIARHDPARVLRRQVPAMRAILGLHVPLEDSGEPPQCVICLEYVPCRTLRYLAAVYSDHPDYRPGWAP